MQRSFRLQNRVVNAMASVMTDEELEMTAEVMVRVGDAIDHLIQGVHRAAGREND